MPTTFSWAKVAYSGVLLGVMFLLVGELYRLWFDTTLHVGTFQFFEQGEEKPALGKGFAQQVIYHHRRFTYLFAQEAARRMAGSTAAANPAAEATLTAGKPLQENTWWPKEVVPIKDPQSALSDLDLSFQGINVKQLLTSLRQWISTPNEIHGYIEKGNEVRGTVTWAQGPNRAAGDLVDGQLIEIPSQSDTSAAAAQAACGVIWAQAARKEPDLSNVSSMNFAIGRSHGRPSLGCETSLRK